MRAIFALAALTLASCSGPTGDRASSDQNRNWCWTYDQYGYCEGQASGLEDELMIWRQRRGYYRDGWHCYWFNPSRRVRCE